jgi:SAM-dependent methyltransferase
LELGPGLRPRLPIAGTYFVDISAAAGHQLRARGGFALTGHIGALPFSDASFDLVCACDVIEHVQDDSVVFRELSRVLKDGGILIFAVPLHARLWTEFDTWVGHAHRYDPDELSNLIADNDLALEQSGIYGMQPTNTRWLRWGMWYMTHLRTWATFWYNWIGMPVATMLQEPLALANGFIQCPDAAELLFVCRRQSRTRLTTERFTASRG